MIVILALIYFEPCLRFFNFTIRAYALLSKTTLLCGYPLSSTFFIEDLHFYFRLPLNDIIGNSAAGILSVREWALILARRSTDNISAGDHLHFLALLNLNGFYHIEDCGDGCFRLAGRFF